MEAITWTQIGAVLTVLGFLFGIVKWVLAEFRRRDERAAAIHAAATMRVETVERALNDFRVEAARTFALNEALADTERNVSDAMKGVYERLDAMTRRLDNLLTELIKQRSNTS